MDKEVYGYLRKLSPMPGKIPGAEAAAFNRCISTWPQIDYSGH